VLEDALVAFIDALPRQPGTIPAKEGQRALGALRKFRRFPQMLRAAQAILNDGSEDAQVYRQYAQALIETGMPVAAIGVLDVLIAREEAGSREWAEAQGVRGRAWKDIAVATRNTRADLASNAIRQSYDSYTAVHRDDPAALYQGINRIALAAWDRGLALSVEERDAAMATLPDMIDRVEAERKRGNPAIWTLATGGEAMVAAGRLDTAAAWFADYINHPFILDDAETGAFALASTARQLGEMWNLGDTPEGQAILAPLTARILQLPGGRFTASTAMIGAMEAVPEAAYEKVLGNTGPRTARWMQRGFTAAHSVALIEDEGRGIGTGFLVKGCDLDNRLDDALYLVTNAHVVSDPTQYRAAMPADVRVRFELSDDPALRDEGVAVERIVWQSSIDDHDATILALADLPEVGVKQLTLARDLPLLDGGDGPSRVYIIGHPRGGEISFSFQDNELLDYEPEDSSAPDDPRALRLHYRTPTEPGNSGSPIFNGDWRVIGLHHSGSREMRRLNDKPGTYPANEGISIQSIRRAMAKDTLG